MRGSSLLESRRRGNPIFIPSGEQKGSVGLPLADISKMLQGMSNLQKLSVFGLGKLGACMAATFAQKGFDVLGVDINAEAVGKINAGEPPVG